jgi:pyruvate formate lyase activating enzyme
MSAEEVLKDVMRDKVFYDTSGGGITLSGGEPMAQFDFTYELLSLAKKEGLHTCMETCGFALTDQYEKIAPLVDIFLFDYKETDSKLHREYTGVPNEPILHNLKVLDSLGARTILRCPIIPTCNDRDEHFEGIARIANSLKNVIEINVEPYHPLGKGKSELLGRYYSLSDISFPKEETVKEWMEKISSKTSVPVKKA